MFYTMYGYENLWKAIVKSMSIMTSRQSGGLLYVITTMALFKVCYYYDELSSLFYIFVIFF